MHAAVLGKRVRTPLLGLNKRDIDDLQRRGRQIRTAILNASLPAGIADQVIAANRTLSENDQHSINVAVRSSMTAKDLSGASFAGQQKSCLNIEGDRALLAICERCSTPFFSDRAISYREDQGYANTEVVRSIGIQALVRSDLGTSVAMLSIDSETGIKNAELIFATYGLAANVVQGAFNLGECYVFKRTFKTGYRPILQKRLANKEIKMIYDD